MRRISKTEKKIRRSFLHGVLILGSLVFAIPFIWLLSSSSKVPDEMYPPRWIPQAPDTAPESPYIQIRANEKPERPTKVKLADWDRLTGPIQAAITRKLESLADGLPEFYRPYLSHPVLAEAIFARLTKRAPDELFEKVEDVSVSWFTQNTDAAIAREVFETVYRNAAVSDVAFHGWDVTVENPTAGEKYNWKVVKGKANLIPRKDGLLRAEQEIDYSFEQQPSFAVQTSLPLQMDPKNLKRIVVSNHGDRTWHEIWATVELGGKRFEAAQAAFMGTDRWQDTIWQFRSEDDTSIKMKTWLRLEDAGASDFNQPGQVRVTLEYRKAAFPIALYNKYVNNYRDVLRTVPLWDYVRNSLWLVAFNMVGQIIGSSLVAYSFARLQWPARDFCFTLVLATLMIPPQVTMIPVFLIFKTLGWYNTLKPLWIGSFFGSAFYIFLLRQFMKGIPKDLEDSAKIDGCGYLGIFVRIIMPLVKPAIATIGIFTFMGVWNDFMGPLIYLNDQRLYPLSLGLFALQVFSLTNYGFMMAASVLMTIPVVVLFFAAQRHFIQGVTLTGMKG
ncbi:MAG: ABC transporter permease subunit [Candidatus Hydrogenedentes bacterium]|nr:ABC transporter permease subunit [Candidatus Hydrogenedentota bacterium]